MTGRAMAPAATFVLLAACGVDPRTERGPVSLADGQVGQVGPQELAVSVSSCNGDLELAGLVEADRKARTRIVTTMGISGDALACLDEAHVTLRHPLGNRAVIDAESGETLRVVELHPEPSAPEPPQPIAAGHRFAPGASGTRRFLQ